MATAMINSSFYVAADEKGNVAMVRSDMIGCMIPPFPGQRSSVFRPQSVSDGRVVNKTGL